MKTNNLLIEINKPVIETTIKDKFFRWWSVFFDLFFIRWANIRNEWYFHVLIGPIFPLAMLLFMRLVGAISDPETGLYMTAGNAILALVLGPMQSLNNDLAIAKQRNDLDYYATLPFGKLQFILAFASVSAIFTIPAMIITLTVGAIWLGFPVSFNPLILPMMIAAGLSMAGVGVFLGVNAKNIHHANMLNTISMMVIMFMSPVLIPLENLPRVLQWTSRILPPSYAAEGYRAALAGSYGIDVWGNMAILLIFAFGLLFLATTKLDWREK